MKLEGELNKEKNATNNWWEKDSDSDDNEVKWDYLEHHGVLFPEFFKRHSIQPKYAGKPIQLTGF